ncbi:MAG: HNH endonuclease [Burkholderiales bacterium]|nr:HNH endonuclease [Burkholderiales bacterium]
MPLINIDGIVSFAPNVGVLVHRAALNVTPHRLAGLIEIAYSHMADEALREACHGGSGPLARYSELSYNEYLRLLELIRVAEAGAKAKKTHTKIRRNEFNATRSYLVLAMLDAGASYVCAMPGCKAAEHLTVDHIKPLSRGGTDELSNLRFLCRSHNSIKRDKDEVK